MKPWGAFLAGHVFTVNAFAAILFAREGRDFASWAFGILAVVLAVSFVVRVAQSTPRKPALTDLFRHARCGACGSTFPQGHWHSCEPRARR